MRRFVVIGHRAVTSGNFNLNDLCGSTGRLDVLLRCINSAFFLSHDIRRDVELYLVLQGEPDPPKTIRLVGNELKYLNPDERSTGALVRNALIKKIEDGELISTPGIYVSKADFKDVLTKLVETSKIVYMKEEGGEFKPEADQDYTFVLGDDRDLTTEEEALVHQFGPEMASLGPFSYHSDHCIIQVQTMMDKV